MSGNSQRLESCWDLVLQDTLLDVAAAVAATEPQPSAEPQKLATAKPALTLDWVVREPIGKASLCQ